MKTNRISRRLRLESMEKRELFAADLGMDLALATAATSPGQAEIDFVEVGGGDSADGYDTGDWFVADSFSFGVEREMKESGEKGGTADINIGVGELQECTVSKTMDAAFAKLAQDSDGLLDEVTTNESSADTGERAPYYKIKLEKVHVTHLSVSNAAE